jgi:hypothetical protein
MQRRKEQEKLAHGPECNGTDEAGRIEVIYSFASLPLGGLHGRGIKSYRGFTSMMFPCRKKVSPAGSRMALRSSSAETFFTLT